MLLCFFFSSRRRHTRCLSDWSSDVCSSDLEAVDKAVRAPAADGFVDRLSPTCLGVEGADVRSEERRVGKECGDAGATGNLKENENLEKHVALVKRVTGTLESWGRSLMNKNQ